MRCDSVLGMEHEWPVYVSMCRMIPVDVNDTEPKRIMAIAPRFWKEARITLPCIAELAYIAFTLTPSSAAAERVFSLLKNMFTKQQMTSALTDYTTASVMLAHYPDLHHVL